MLISYLIVASLFIDVDVFYENLHKMLNESLLIISVEEESPQNDKTNNLFFLERSSMLTSKIITPLNKTL